MFYFGFCFFVSLFYFVLLDFSADVFVLCSVFLFLSLCVIFVVILLFMCFPALFWALCFYACRSAVFFRWCFCYFLNFCFVWLLVAVLFCFLPGFGLGLCV